MILDTIRGVALFFVWLFSWLYAAAIVSNIYNWVTT